MNNQLFSIMILLASLLGPSCTVQEDPVPVEEIEETVIFDNEELFTPSGLLGYIYTYQFNDKDYSYKSRRFYDEKNRNIIRIAMLPEGDTTGLSKNIYDDQDRMVERKSYYYSGIRNQYLRYEYIFENGGQIEKVISHSPDRPSRFFYQNIYDEQGRLIEKQFTEDRYGEKYMFEYEGDRIRAMLWTSGKNENDDTKPIVLGHLYRYNEKGLLVAKEYFKTRKIPETGEGNMFEYEYDKHGRLIEEREYVPTQGFAPLLRKTYEYYE